MGLYHFDASLLLLNPLIPNQILVITQMISINFCDYINHYNNNYYY